MLFLLFLLLLCYSKETLSVKNRGENYFCAFSEDFQTPEKNCRKEPSYYQDPKNASNNKCCRNHWIFISFCIFLNGLWCGNFPVIFAVKLLRQSMLFEVDCLSVKVLPVEFLTLKHPHLRTFAEVFLEKVSLPKSLITIACGSLTLIFFNIIPAIRHTATYFAAL